ncbi:MAG: TIGR04282 family arsenosugar biosynthesis glycosyltransferase [Candidatus Binatia bacterium]
MPIYANALVVMAKAPIPGQVKTRLVPPLSPAEAAELSRCLLLDQLEALKSFQEADRFLAYAPAGAAAFFQELACFEFVCLAQRGEDLGARMQGIFEDLAKKGYRSVVVIGGDLPVFPGRFLDEAFSRLADGTEIVLGPARDGGYYLIGLRRPIAELFQGITWGGEEVLTDTAQKIARLGLRCHLLPMWFDIDTAQDLRDLEAMSAPLSVLAQRQTHRFLNAHPLRF